MVSLRPVIVVMAITALVGLTAGAPRQLAAASDDVAKELGTLSPERLSATDWGSIRAAYERGRHAVLAVPGASRTWRARTPSQQWTALFDGRGVLVTPDAGDWTWGLSLTRYGIAGAERRVNTTARAAVDQQRVTYTWNALLDEWFVNDPRGLEHGFTLHARPGGGAGAVVLELAVRGGLTPQVQPDGRGLTFRRGTAAVVTYSALSVLDADGRALPARFEPMDEAVRLVVDDRGARYPVTIDPIAQQAYLKASNTAGEDEFGGSVAVSGDTVVVGATGEDSAATGVNGDQANNSASGAGAAYVFVRNGGVWSQQAYLKASNTDAFDQFGVSVAVFGDTVVVGAYSEDSAASGVNGDETNNTASNAGAAYVFVRNGGVWSQEAYLKASNTDENDRFGFSIAVSGDTAIVGAYREDSNATGVNGDQTNNIAPGAGAAYVFVRSGGVWSQQAYLKASNTGVGNFFGHSVAISGDTVVVGAYGEDSSATGVNGNGADNSAPDAGATYVFVRSGAVWSQQAYLKASNTGADDSFGVSVAVSGDTVVVGAAGEDSAATGLNGDQTNNGAAAAGAAYVFVRTGGVWSQLAYLKASNAGAQDFFGVSVAVSDDTVVVGAAGEDSAATGVNGDQTNRSAKDVGAGYVFVRSGGGWSQESYLKASNTKASNTGADDSFGGGVAVSGDTVVVGATGEDSAATGINGDQTNDGASDAGAAYVFVLSTGSNLPPTVGSVTPASGSGPGQTFSVVVSDPNGFADISGTALLVAGATGEFCLVFVDRASTALLLLNDAASGWLGPVLAGSAGTLQNSQCLVNAAGSSVAGVGTDLTVGLALTFTGTFAGAKATAAVATDGAGQSSNWQLTGTFTVTNAPPTVTSVTPAAGQGFSQTFSYVFTDANGFADVAWGAVLIDGGVNVVNSCLVFVQPATTGLLLLNDTGSAWLGPVLAGSGDTLQNSQCTVNAAGTSVSGAGPTLTLHLALTFTPAYAGTKNNLAVATDGANQTSGWQAPGTWSVPPPP